MANIRKGKEYECIVPDGQVCVWSPEEYPTYWQEVLKGEEWTESGEEEQATPEPID